MDTEHEAAERRLSRQALLKWAAVTGGAGLIAGRAGLAGAMRALPGAESGHLQVLDWAGYGNDGGQAMFADYVKKYPNNKPQFTVMSNEADALAKLNSGDVGHHPIGNEQRGLIRAKKIDRFAAIFSEHHAVLFGRKSLFDKFAIQR